MSFEDAKQVSRKEVNDVWFFFFFLDRCALTSRELSVRAHAFVKVLSFYPPLQPGCQINMSRLQRRTLDLLLRRGSE